MEKYIWLIYRKLVWKSPVFLTIILSMTDNLLEMCLF